MADSVKDAADKVGIYGHTKPDVDCTTAMWIVARFLLDRWFPGKAPYYQFVGHAQLKKVADDPDFPIIVDGGQVYDPESYRFDTHGSGRLKTECAASLVARELDEQDQKDIKPLVESVRLHDIGSRPPFPTPLPQFYRLLPENGPLQKTLLWHGILDKWYGHQVVEPKHIENAVTFTKVYGSVAVVPHNCPRNTSIHLFRKGYQYVIYTMDTGMGVLAKDRLPYRFSQRVLELLEQRGRSSEFLEWYFKPDGKMACRGSSKGPVEGESCLEPLDIVEVIQDLEKDSQRLPLVAS